MQRIRTLLIQFDNDIDVHEVPLFRGAIIHSLNNKLTLFHNHTKDGYRYRYPMIQYKRIRKKAALFCIGEGVDQVGELFCSFTPQIRIGNREVELKVESITPSNFLVQQWDTPYSYRLRRWLPLNTDNYIKYESLDSLSEKISFLENILVANILSFSKGINLFLKDKVVCKITNILNQKSVKLKGVKLLAIDLEFKCNVSLPNYMGLGKSASLNFGTLTRFYQQDTLPHSSLLCSEY